MVNLPVKLDVPDERIRRSILMALDVLRALVEDGEACYQFDTTEIGADGSRVDLAHFAFRPEAYLERWNRQGNSAN